MSSHHRRRKSAQLILLEMKDGLKEKKRFMNQSRKGYLWRLFLDTRALTTILQKI